MSVVGSTPSYRVVVPSRDVAGVEVVGRRSGVSVAPVQFTGIVASHQIHRWLVNAAVSVIVDVRHFWLLVDGEGVVGAACTTLFVDDGEAYGVVSRLLGNKHQIGFG